MDIHDSATAGRALTRWEQHRFLGLIFLVVCVSLALVWVAMSLYQSSGAAQLDFSRPGYQAVRKEAGGSSSATVSYPAEGPLTDKALNDFKKMYTEQTTKATATQSFQPSALSDESLQLYDKTDTSTTEQ